ncbi:MAG TPA: hypothetical protein VFG69_10980 [Nannocystaceae bacterium]|nr:hypothetical protein [Nannocystaceae bacterium]
MAPVVPSEGPTPGDIVGSIGVALLLAAFALNACGRLRSDSRWYGALNVVGAGLATVASWLIGYLPFVVLEGTWCAVALVGLVRPASRP